MEEIVKKRIHEWTNPPYNRETIDQINSLVAGSRDDELVDRFSTELEFGTGGLRGIIGAGTNRMNIYTVGMATQGLANYLAVTGGTEKGVVIGYDPRIMSREFAMEAASIMAGNNIKVYIFNDIVPVPFVSFGIRELKAKSGIMITASHNPAEYNGYKVYWEDGSQIIPPHDKKIIDEVQKIDSIKKIKKTDYQEAVKNGLIKLIDDEITESYLKNLEGAALRQKEDSEIKIVYSAIHGTGYKIIPRVLRHFGFKNLYTVEEQSVPDGKFPTVRSPNPEEKPAMAMAIELAEKCDADLIMATDPDSDRMGIGFKNSHADYVLINGNQIGTMLEYYLLLRKKEEGGLPRNGIIIKTIVTTELQREVARGFDIKIDDVLTGFKWIADKMKYYENSKRAAFIFGGEESYGYLPVFFVRDKDAVSSCYFFAEMADWIKKRKQSLYEFLDEIYINHNLYSEELKSYTLKGADGLKKIKKIMEVFRDKPPLRIGDVEVKRICDIRNLKDKNMKTGNSVPIKGIPSSNVIQFFLDDDSKITMRPSGTEPKIKFYFSIKDKVNRENLKDYKSLQRDRMGMLVTDFLKIVDDVVK